MDQHDPDLPPLYLYEDKMSHPLRHINLGPGMGRTIVYLVDTSAEGIAQAAAKVANKEVPKGPTSTMTALGKP